jgi:arsenite-transporting ATPase
VLVVSTDPAHSLGDALATVLGPRPSRIPTRRGRLDAAELDADRALARWLTGRRAALRVIAERGTYLDDDDVERLLRLSLPGVDELIGLLELARLAGGDYQEVVVDTAPTGHTLRLLAMPETVRRIAAVLDHMYAKHRFLADRLGGTYRPDASDAVIDELEGEGRELHGLFRDGTRCTFVWVLLPEALSLEETLDGVRELDRRGLAVPELIVNRVTPAPGRPCAVCGPRCRTEQTVVAAVHRRLRGRTIRLLPQAAGEPRGVAALRRIWAALASRPHGVLAGAAARVPSPRLPRRLDLPWRDLLAPPGARLLLFAGKGGVGKTTCAATAALALAGAGSRRRILLLSTDPAHSLGDVLRLPVGDLARALPGVGGLRVRELDAEAAFRTRRDRYRAAVDQLFDVARPGVSVDVAFDRTVVQELIDLAPPGVDELFAVLSVSEALLGEDGAAPAFDLVVVDTAPTGHALRLLALPGVALAWTRTLLAILLKYRQVIRPGRLAEDLVKLSRDLRGLERLLHDRRETRLVVVTRTGEVVRRETSRLLARLGQLDLEPTALLVNALTPDVTPCCSRCAEARAEERRQVAAVRRTRVPVLLAPTVAPPPRGVKALSRWARTWSSA